MLLDYEAIYKIETIELRALSETEAYMYEVYAESSLFHIIKTHVNFDLDDPIETELSVEAERSLGLNCGS